MRRTLLLLLAGVAPLAGCQSHFHTVRLATPVPGSYAAPLDDGVAMRRVAVLPLCTAGAPDALRDVEAAFAAELGSETFFEVVPISRAELEELTGERQLSSVAVLPADLLERLRGKFGAEGVLFTDITHFSPYRPLAIGVRTKLVDASTGQIRWALDHVYDSGSTPVAQAAKAFQRQFSSEHRHLPDDGGSVLLSPARFAKYVASETYAELRHSQPAIADAGFR